MLWSSSSAKSGSFPRDFRKDTQSLFKCTRALIVYANFSWAPSVTSGRSLPSTGETPLLQLPQGRRTRLTIAAKETLKHFTFNTNPLYSTFALQVPLFNYFSTHFLTVYLLPHFFFFFYAVGGAPSSRSTTSPSPSSFLSVSFFYVVAFCWVGRPFDVRVAGLVASR